MERTRQVIITAEPDRALRQVCGISLIERMLRILQRLGLREATMISASPEAIRAQLAQPSWARSEIRVAIRQSREAAVTGADILEVSGSSSAAILLLDGGSYFDPRLIEALLGCANTTLLVDSAPPTGGRGQLCGAAVIEKRWLESGDPNRPIFEQLAEAAEKQQINRIDVAGQPTYLPNLRRNLRPLWFPAPAEDRLRAAERLLLDAAQNGTLDLPAKVHGPIETWIIARLCRTRITPMQITLFTAALSAIATVFFASGQLLAGVIIALTVGILDGLDGKQARVKVETTELGKREHVLDYILELSWWTALAFHFTASAQVQNAYAFLALLVGSDVVDRLAKKQAKHLTGRNLDDVAPIDRFVRLIGGRRNIYIWIFATGLVLGAPDKAFIALCCWGALTAAVHSWRALWLSRQLRGARSKGAAH
jgi:phosphatidylglycerophosphate synthase